MAALVEPGVLVMSSREHGVKDLAGRVVCAVRNELNECLVYNRERKCWEIDPLRGSDVLMKWLDFVSERRATAAIRRSGNGHESELFVAAMDFLGVERAH